MKIYWGLSSVPELAGLPGAERRAIWRTCYRKSFRSKRVWAALIVCGLCTGVGSALGTDFGYELIGAMIGGGVGGLVFSQVSVMAALPHIRATVANRNDETA